MTAGPSAEPHGLPAAARTAAQAGPSPIRRIPAERDVRIFDLYGDCVAFDCNSLAVMALGPARPEGGTADFGVRWKPQFPLASNRTVRKLVLNVTHDCNLACRYCFVRAHRSDRTDQTDQSETMSPALACRAIDHLFPARRSLGAGGDPRTDISISFFGGEPLLAWDTVVAAMEHASILARARGVRASFHITTNGTLLDAERTETLKRYGCSFLVSLDGPAEVHDAWRPFAGGPGAPAQGAGSHAATLRALEWLHAAGWSRRVMARATYPLKNPRLMAPLRYFGALQDRGLIAGFSIEPAIMSEGCAGDLSDRSDLSDLSDQYHAAAEWFLQRKREGRATNFFHFRRILERLLSRRSRATECGAGRGYLTVGPDGTIFACHRESGTAIGHLDYGIDEELRAPWCDNRVYRNAHCMACWARYVCGGSCRQIAAQRVPPTGGINAQQPERCLLMQTLIRECLWILTQAEPAAQQDAARPTGVRLGRRTPVGQAGR